MNALKRGVKKRNAEAQNVVGRISGYIIGGCMIEGKVVILARLADPQPERRVYRASESFLFGIRQDNGIYSGR
jgi:hypothetical protein